MLHKQMEKGPSSTVTGFTTCTQHKRVILHRSLISIFNKRNESRADKALMYSCLSTSVLQFVLIFKLDINDVVYTDFHAYKPLLPLTQFKKKCSTFFFVLQINIPWYFLWPWLLTLIFLMTLTSLVPYFGIILKILLFTLCTVKLIHSTTLSNFLTLTFLHPWFAILHLAYTLVFDKTLKFNVISPNITDKNWLEKKMLLIFIF